jgi:hypothetical protein
MADATAKGLAISAGIMVDKAHLLRGEPTAIYSHKDMKTFHELGATITRKVKRRGITIDPETVDEGRS